MYMYRMYVMVSLYVARSDKTMDDAQRLFVFFFVCTMIFSPFPRGRRLFVFLFALLRLPAFAAQFSPLLFFLLLLLLLLLFFCLFQFPFKFLLRPSWIPNKSEWFHLLDPCWCHVGTCAIVTEEEFVLSSLAFDLREAEKEGKKVKGKGGAMCERKKKESGTFEEEKIMKTKIPRPDFAPTQMDNCLLGP